MFCRVMCDERGGGPGIIHPYRATASAERRSTSIDSLGLSNAHGIWVWRGAMGPACLSKWMHSIFICSAAVQRCAGHVLIARLDIPVCQIDVARTGWAASSSAGRVDQKESPMGFHRTFF